MPLTYKMMHIKSYVHEKFVYATSRKPEKYIKMYVKIIFR